MKLIGHVSTAVIVASPLIYFRDELAPVMGGAQPGSELMLGAGHYFIITALAATMPDLDIILQRFLPIKHRGFASHSLWTALFAGVLLLLGWGAGGVWSEQVSSWLGADISAQVLPVLQKWCNGFTALLVFLGVFVHILGDSLTVSGVPMLYPKQEWKFPVVGGHARFDNYFLNAIPCLVAAYILNHYFGYGAGFLHHLGSWSKVGAYFK